MSKTMKMLLIAALLGGMGLAHADTNDKYIKPNGEAVIKTHGQTLRFAISSMSSSASMPSTCSMEGETPMSDATHAKYVSSDKLDKCEVSFSFGKDQLEIKVAGCKFACSTMAVGSLDGVYKKKVSGK